MRQIRKITVGAMASLLILGGLILDVSAVVVSAADQSVTSAAGGAQVGANEVDSTLAKLSDEQVRNLLIAELRARAAAEGNQADQEIWTIYGAIVDWLRLFDSDAEAMLEKRGDALLGAATQLPRSLNLIFLRLGNGTGFASSFFSVMSIVLIFAAASLAVLGFKALTPAFREQKEADDIPDLGGYMRFWAGSLRVLAGAVDIMVFLVAALAVVSFTPLWDRQVSRYLFLAMLLVFAVVRGGGLLSQFVFSPAVPALRLLRIGDTAAATCHRIVVFALAYVLAGLSFIGLAAELGMPPEGVVVITVILGSVLLLLTIGLVVVNRRSVADYISSTETADSGGDWVVRQFARFWHIPALAYLLFVWAIFVHHQVLGIQPKRAAFLLSLLVVPIFFLLDRLGHWVVEKAIRVLKIYQDPEAEEKSGESTAPGAEEKEKLLTVRVFRWVRLAILLALFGWVLHIWGYTLPFVNTITEAVFRSLVIMAVALLAWHILSGYIEKRLLEEEPEEPVEEDQDSEWGSPVARGRAYTLLPMVRKFIGAVLVIMVVLTILSTVGIEIGPLLAGAGVVGLAIGFGAQKLVSDVFSGFFFLLDDAFRVGEYLEASGVSGAVEGITMRNILLRHHRGMLQIVPYSELGPITNYMRGGVVVKFNLEFPYDTDIDLVRRIIKKVGKAMLEDEDFGKDFIRPVKSQGVREITNSVMVIRVKFTAQPGTHFVIRREAYRRITEALAAKGIYYAHRKVIVELPDDIRTAEAEDRKRIAEAGAAAAMKAEEQTGKGSKGG